MSNTNSVFKKVPAEVQNRNGFDESHMNFLTSKIGTLTPVLVDRLIPGDKLTLGSTFRVTLPPMATDFLGKVTANVRAFFVPHRLLYGGWKRYMMYSGGLADQFKPAGLVTTYIPTITPTTAESGAGSLLDYLGVRTGFSATVDSDFALAYHLVWSDWYRDPRVQSDPFDMGVSDTDDIACVRDTTFYASKSFSTVSANASFVDGTSVFDLRQVNYEKDYFTTAFTDQYGGATPMSVGIGLSVDSTASSTTATGKTLYAGTDSNFYAGSSNVAMTGSYLTSLEFTIPQLRQANALQKFAEQNALSGGVYQDLILANYGVRPADGLVDRSIYLGSLSASVYNNTVYATTSNDNPEAAATNPFAGQQASSSANSKAIGSGSLCTFEAKESGVFIVLMDVQPHAVYSTGVRRALMSHLEGSGYVDRFCVPNLAGIGHQPIYQGELNGNSAGFTSSTVFGYTDRYADMKWHLDEVHGLLKDGQSLEAFSLQRPFSTTDTPTISSSFIEVATTDMDNVTAVASDLSSYGYWCDMFHSYKLSRPLPAYSIPSLENDSNMHNVMVDRGGRRF